MRSGLRSPLLVHRRRRPVGVATDWAMTEALVGAGHPLVGVLRGLKTTRDQVLMVTAIQVIAAVLLLERVPLALPLFVAGGVVLTALGCRVAFLRSRRRDECRELIIRGGDWLPLAPVELESRRFRDIRYQTRLALALEEIADIAECRRFQSPIVAVVCHVRVLRPVAPQLREIVSLLLSGRAAVCGVALVEQLLVFGDSPLYGTRAEPLRQELGRARYLLIPRS
jgi:hypothetical protein